MKSESTHQVQSRASQSGLTLLETMVALVILLITTVGLMSMGAMATGTTENQGHLAARTSEYAQDKIEQLMALNYGDSQTDTTQFPPVASGGTGLTVGGSSDPSNPSTSYVDYLDSSGNLLTLTNGTPPSNWFYIRVWQISQFSTNLKQITVTARVKVKVGAPQGSLPQSTLTTLKSSPF